MSMSQNLRADTGDGTRGRYDLAGAPEGLGSLISGVVKDLQDLLRAEIQLAKTEVKEDATAAGKGIAFIAAGAFVGLVGFIFLMLAATYLLNKYFQMWIAAGIVALALLLIAAILASRGRSQVSAGNLKPEQTIETLKEDQAWAKQQINSVKR
jgi:VIT1/CCC1 family predicted Fe2+/Mn2+ transporter